MDLRPGRTLELADRSCMIMESTRITSGTRQPVWITLILNSEARRHTGDPRFSVARIRADGHTRITTDHHTLADASASYLEQAGEDA